MTVDPSISVIIPALNEESYIGATVERARKCATAEVLIVDGGSSDLTREVAGEHGARVLKCAPGRARQMNAGADVSRGKFLVFLHADTLLPAAYDATVHEILADPRTALGAFKLLIEGDRFALRLLEHMVDLRSRLFRLPYGDQALFVRRDLFDKLGGFSDQPIMEDYTFVRKARKHGRTVIAGAAVVTSSRRWQRLGIWKTTLLNQRMLLGYHLGTPLEKLANQYCNAR